MIRLWPRLLQDAFPNSSLTAPLERPQADPSLSQELLLCVVFYLLYSSVGGLLFFSRKQMLIGYVFVRFLR